MPQFKSAVGQRKFNLGRQKLWFLSALFFIDLRLLFFAKEVNFFGNRF